MTGFGKATCEYNNKKIVVEVKSLNSKQLDVSTRISGLYREKDIEIRNEISQQLERGVCHGCPIFVLGNPKLYLNNNFFQEHPNNSSPMGNDSFFRSDRQCCTSSANKILPAGSFFASPAAGSN